MPKRAAPATPEGKAAPPARSKVLAPRPSPEWERRKNAAAKYRPKTVKLLLVAEAPPADGYFYFEDAAPDPLFDDLTQVLFEAPPATADRTPYLKELRRRGIFLIELKPDAPLERGESLAPYADWLPTRVEVLEPAHIVLLGAAVHGAAIERLKQAGLPVEDSRIAFREGGDRKEARGQLRAALVRAGLEKLIRELPSKARETLPRDPVDSSPPPASGAPSKPQRSRPPGKRTPASSR